MNGKKSKALRKMSYQLAAEWLKSMLPEEEAEKVTPQSVERFEANQEKYVFGKDVVLCSAYSSRWFLKRLKKAFKRNQLPDFQITLTQLTQMGYV